jgi:hypothetical protein
VDLDPKFEAGAKGKVLRERTTLICHTFNSKWGVKLLLWERWG